MIGVTPFRVLITLLIIYLEAFFDLVSRVSKVGYGGL